MLRILLWLLCLSFIYKAKAQNNCKGILKAQVLDIVSNTPVSDVAVFLLETNKGNYTDSTGWVQLNDICKGSFTLVCKHLNHEATKEKFFMNNEVTYKTIYIACHTDTLGDLVISGSKMHKEDIAVLHTLNASEIQSGGVLHLGNILEKINGVFNINTGQHIQKPMIRGMHSNRLLILNNNVRLEGQQWGIEHAPELDATYAHDIEVIKGAQSIRYGSDAIGGVVLVNDKSLWRIKKTAIQHSAYMGSNGGNIAATLQAEGNANNDKIFWRASASKKRAGNMRTPDYYLKNTGMDQWSYVANIGYKYKGMKLNVQYTRYIAKVGIYAGSHIGNLSDLYAAFTSSTPTDTDRFKYKIAPPYQYINHQTLLSKLTIPCGENTNLLLQYSFQNNVRKEYDNNIFSILPDGTYKPVLDFKLNTHQVEAAIENKWIQKMNGTIAYQGLIQNNAYYGYYFIPNYQKQVHGIYISEKKYHEKMSAELSIRYDIQPLYVLKWEHNVLKEYHHLYRGPAVAASLRYQLPSIVLHVNAGSAWRAPHVNELYSYGVHHSAATFEVGDPLLKPERSYQCAITIDYKYKKWLSAEWTIYNNYFNNYILIQPVLPATLTIRGAFPTFAYSNTQANIYGSELAVQTQLHSHIQWNMKVAIMRAYDISYRRGVYGMPPTRISSDMAYILYEKNNNKLHTSLNALYVTKQNNVIVEQDYIAPPPAYLLFNYYLIWEKNNKNVTYKVEVGVQNVLNTRYRDYLNRNRYFADNAGRNIYLRYAIPLGL